MKVLGLMSGTSMDGLDLCYVDLNININYDLSFKIIDTDYLPFPNDLYNFINSVVGNKNKLIISKAHDELGKIFLDMSSSFLNGKKIDLISMHGQTISHIDGKHSKQIGNPKFLNDYFKVPVVYNFRKKDIFMGGSGAPLMSFLDWLLYKNKSHNENEHNISPKYLIRPYDFVIS